MATYSADSPYANTGMQGNYLDVLNYRAIPAEIDDTLHELSLIHI